MKSFDVPIQDRPQNRQRWGIRRALISSVPMGWHACNCSCSENPEHDEPFRGGAVPKSIVGETMNRTSTTSSGRSGPTAFGAPPARTTSARGDPQLERTSRLHAWRSAVPGAGSPYEARGRDDPRAPRLRGRVGGPGVLRPNGTPEARNPDSLGRNFGSA